MLRSGTSFGEKKQYIWNVLHFKTSLLQAALRFLGSYCRSLFVFSIAKIYFIDILSLHDSVILAVEPDL